MASRALKINKNFGKIIFSFLPYRLATFEGSEYLVSNVYSSSEVRVFKEKIAELDMTASVIRNLKSGTWSECIAPKCIAEYLLEYDPTCFRNVAELILLDDEGNVLEDQNE